MHNLEPFFRLYSGHAFTTMNQKGPSLPVLRSGIIRTKELAVTKGCLTDEVNFLKVTEKYFTPYY